jgi:hypothetical protein
MQNSLLGLTVDQVAQLVNFQQSQRGPLPMIPHGHPDANTLINMGQYNPIEHWPASQRDFVEKGEKPSTFGRDLGTVNNQVPQWAWFIMAGGFSVLAYFSYREHKKSKKGKKKQ